MFCLEIVVQFFGAALVDETEVRVTLARVVPERELWLYENRAASAAVMRGQADANDLPP